MHLSPSSAGARSARHAFPLSRSPAPPIAERDAFHGYPQLLERIRTAPIDLKFKLFLWSLPWKLAMLHEHHWPDELVQFFFGAIRETRSYTGNSGSHELFRVLLLNLDHLSLRQHDELVVLLDEIVPDLADEKSRFTAGEILVWLEGEQDAFHRFRSWAESASQTRDENRLQAALSCLCVLGEMGASEVGTAAAPAAEIVVADFDPIEVDFALTRLLALAPTEHDPREWTLMSLASDVAHDDVALTAICREFMSIFDDMDDIDRENTVVQMLGVLADRRPADSPWSDLVFNLFLDMLNPRAHRLAPREAAALSSVLCEHFDVLTSTQKGGLLDMLRLRARYGAGTLNQGLVALVVRGWPNKALDGLVPRDTLLDFIASAPAPHAWWDKLSRWAMPWQLAATAGAQWDAELFEFFMDAIDSLADAQGAWGHHEFLRALSANLPNHSWEQKERVLGLMSEIAGVLADEKSRRLTAKIIIDIARPAEAGEIFRDWAQLAVDSNDAGALRTALSGCAILAGHCSPAQGGAVTRLDVDGVPAFVLDCPYETIVCAISPPPAPGEWLMTSLLAEAPDASILIHMCATQLEIIEQQPPQEREAALRDLPFAVEQTQAGYRWKDELFNWFLTLLEQRGVIAEAGSESICVVLKERFETFTETERDALWAAIGRNAILFESAHPRFRAAIVELVAVRWPEQAEAFFEDAFRTAPRLALEGLNHLSPRVTLHADA